MAKARVAGRQLLKPDDIERLEEHIDAHRSTSAVLDALERLKPRSREALLLVGVDGLTPAEAACALGIAAPAFRMRLTVARRALTRALQAEADQPPQRNTPTAFVIPTPTPNRAKPAIVLQEAVK